MLKLFIVGTGGFFGAVLRFMVSALITDFFPAPFIPLGTFSVNVIGSFLMGVANGYLFFHSLMPENLRYLLMTGFLGAFTTYSTFSIEAFFLFNENNFSGAVIYIFLHLILCIGSAAGGYYLMRII